MTNREIADRIEQLCRGTTFGYRMRPHSPRWNEIMRLLPQITDAPPPPPPPPPPNRYAPRAYNTAPNGSDARFCMAVAYGVVRSGTGYVDAMGVRYDEGGRDLGGRTKTLVPGLKPANEMDDRAPCDPYQHEGRMIGGVNGYPAASFER